MDDLISRQAVIDMIDKEQKEIDVSDVSAMYAYSKCKTIIKQLPTELGTNLADLAEVGTDCISRQQAIDALAAMPCKSDEDGYIWIVRFDAWKRIDALPPAEPKRGKWIRDGHHIRCDQCGMYMCDTDREGDRIPTEFCPSCGADMRGEQNG